jgi:hypothetical protein
MICDPLSEERTVPSHEKIIPFRVDFGYQYILNVPNDFKGFAFSYASVLKGTIGKIDMLFFPNMELEDNTRSGILITKSILQNTKLIISYGNVCSGDGYEVTYIFSEKSEE